MKREPVSATPRRSMTPARKRVLRERQGDLCAYPRCGEPWTEVDHRIPLAMGGADDDSNFTGLCGPHHKHKTRQDVAMIAKAKRLAGETCVGPTKRPLRSRPFPTNIRRRLNGTVENRA